MHSGEQYLTQKLSEDIGGRINLGRSSGDLNKVGDRIKMRDSLLDVMDAVNGCRKALLKTAAEHVTTVMPGYTHGQQAQPTTLGHQLLCWAIVLSRDFARLESAFGRINLSPAGCGIMTGSDFPLNRHRVAELLGFARPSENTLPRRISLPAATTSAGEMKLSVPASSSGPHLPHLDKRTR